MKRHRVLGGAEGKTEGAQKVLTHACGVGCDRFNVAKKRLQHALEKIHRSTEVDRGACK